MGIQPRIDLIVAKLDLQLVRMLRQAMREADRASGKGTGLPAAATPAFLPRLRYHPTPLIEPRPRIHPTPLFEPRPVIHPRQRVELQPPCSPPAHPEQPRIVKSPIQPPWKVLPWQNPPPPPPPRVKVPQYHPDVPVKGTVLDVFI